MNATYKGLTDAMLEFETKKLFIRAPEKVRNGILARKLSPSTPLDFPLMWIE